MKYGIESYKDLCEISAYIITSLSIFLLMIGYRFSKKQIHFSTMAKCINDFRVMMKSDLSEDNLAEQYIDLVNEEFFYLENNFVPHEVSIEWIDGMIDYLPFFSKEGKFEKSRMLSVFDNPEATKNLLVNYPRVMKVIQLNRTINFEIIHQDIIEEEDRQLRRKERNKLIRCIILSLNIRFCTKFRLKYKISNR